MDPEAVTDVSQREAEFFDEDKRSYRLLRGLIDSAIEPFYRGDEYRHYYDATGKDVLDYGCGEGRVAFEALSDGAATVTGLDISEERISRAQEIATERGVSDRATFIAGDATNTDFQDGSFDLILGGAILHHMDLRKAFCEIRRVLKPGGRAVFVEPLIHNPILRLGRLLTPSARTPDETPLSVADWELCASIFPAFEHHEREFISIPLIPLNLLLPARLKKRLARRVARWDDVLLARFPRLRRHARITILVLR